MRRISVLVFAMSVFAINVVAEETSDTASQGTSYTAVQDTSNVAVQDTSNVVAHKTSFSVGVDFQSRYVWRGLPLGGSVPSIQPAATFNWEGLEAGVWGAFSTSTLSTQELDLYVSYTFWKDMFSVAVTDYCFPTVDHDANFKYFNYGRNTTHHVFEAGIAFNGTEKVPVKAGFYINFYGNDKNADGNNAYSSYAEVSYNPSVKKWGVDFDIFAGCALTGYDFYATKNNGFGFINLGAGITKYIKINDSFSFPVYTRLIFNPDANQAYFVAGLGISL
ncbi:MAG: hypothetical protein LBT04_07630 [Prevotellaceae bacterium]|jgi:hypothetical protein|nr:hypothetical protein [Prevotellaceae bacterium]